jgi:hypothetical protein
MMQRVKITLQRTIISKEELAERPELWDLFPDRGIIAKAQQQNPQSEILVTEEGWFVDGVRQPDPQYRWRPKSIVKFSPDE